MKNDKKSNLQITQETFETNTFDYYMKIDWDQIEQEAEISATMNMYEHGLEIL